ncbi:hypothetical protein [Nonomuraea jabiensis]|uniref:hypothetical protein n=1 Tax=Nonomuraea jabiensis TaxID=882448 RepID=UPI0036849BB7
MTRPPLSRQTVYAHFLSRDALIAALVEAAAAEYSALLDAAGLETAPPADALARFLDAGWEFLRRYPLLLDPTTTSVHRPESNDPHDVVPARLERLIRRGQDTGDFDPSPGRLARRRRHRTPARRGLGNPGTRGEPRAPDGYVRGVARAVPGGLRRPAR